MRLFKLTQRQPIFKIYSAKYASQHPLRFLETQDRWRKIDNVPNRWQLIYKAPMDSLLNFATVYLTFSTTTVAMSSLYYAAFVFDKTDFDSPVLLGDSVVIADSAIECFTYVGAFIAFHVAVKLLLSKYVVRLYQDGDNYIAIFRGHFYNSIKKHEFNLRDFKKVNSTLAIAWSDARYSLGNKKAVILENYFKTPEHFNYLLSKKKSEQLNDDE